MDGEFLYRTLYTGTGNGTSTIGNNESWSLSQTGVNISTWYCAIHLILVPVPAPGPFPCSVNVVSPIFLAFI